MQRVVDLLNGMHADLGLTADPFSGFMFKRLSIDSSIAVPKGDGIHGNQEHLTLTGIDAGVDLAED